MGNPLMVQSVGLPIQSPTMMSMSHMLLGPNMPVSRNAAFGPLGSNPMTTYSRGDGMDPSMSLSNAALGSVGSNRMMAYNSGGGMDPTLELLLLERRRAMFHERHQEEMLVAAAMARQQQQRQQEEGGQE